MNIGKLEDLDIRKVWPTEDKHFTPWIAENINLISDKIGVSLEDVSIESKVGSFSADLVCRESITNNLVIIENQFGDSNHDHLGKLLTYTSGKEAKIAIWIAEKFRDEHIATLEYLNEISKEDGISLFAIEIHVKKIGESAPAPEFDIIVKPNLWSKQLSNISYSETDIKRRELRLDFYTKLADEYKLQNPHWNKVKAQPQHWLQFGSGKASFTYVWAFKSTNGYRFGIELYIDTKDKATNERILHEIETNKSEIEKEIGLPVDFQELPESRGCRIEISTPTGVAFTKLSDTEKSKLITWGTKYMKIFTNTLQKYIKDIDY